MDTSKLKPKLRTVERYEPPYPLNKFPADFEYELGKELIFFIATRTSLRVTKKGKLIPYVRLEGSDWEEMFANAIRAEWTPTNVGLDDIRFEQCAWGAKTVKGKRPSNVSRVRLISGRNSPTYSFGVKNIKDAPLQDLGGHVLQIWNERVYAIRKKWKHLRSVVLIKSEDLSEVAVFEFDTEAYPLELYDWKWNKKENLEGFDKQGNHKFTWQPHGSQFTIVEEVPEDRLCLQVKVPMKLDKQKYLDDLKVDKSWVWIKNEKPKGEVAGGTSKESDSAEE